MRNRASAPAKNGAGKKVIAGAVERPALAAVAGPYDTLTLPELRYAVESWLLDSEARLSPKTTRDRRWLTDKLLWWLERDEASACGKRELQRFFVYVRTGHEEEGGRWGAGETSPVRPQTAANYFRWLRTFFLFCVAEGYLEESPLRTMRPPSFQQDQVEPFTEEQIRELIAATKRSRQPKRDLALLLLLLDTGARAAEVCGLRLGDFDMHERTIRVLGKGNVHRTLHLTARTTRAIVDYLRTDGAREEDAPLFVSVGGHSAGDALTVNGLRQVVERLGDLSGIEGVRCSPHTFRHTFAVEFLRNGGDPLTLQSLYGHTSLEMTRKYVLFSQADRKRKHSQFSPVAKLKR